jgi:hypothetical protein
LDCYIWGRDQAPAVAECKARKGGAGFTTLEKWLGEFCLLFLKRNHAELLIVMPWRTYERLIRKDNGVTSTRNGSENGNDS